ncbi:hypothetical protein [Kitasatospora sp. NPDC059827]|uniref:hypothetical protein n=1 Tax=Kitasatospora sp. NPDC059827 TaxID=3346964 RepID=UPI00364A193C
MARINGDSPSRENPVAYFDINTYRWVAELSNRDFMRLRDRVLGMPGFDSRTRSLKASFHSNGVTGIPGLLQSDAVWKAAAQHDFRYTIGPNVMDGAAADRDREEADTQFHREISEIRRLNTGQQWLDQYLEPVDRTLARTHADAKWAILRLLGKTSYYRSPVNPAVSFGESARKEGWLSGPAEGIDAYWG